MKTSLFTRRGKATPDPRQSRSGRAERDRVGLRELSADLFGAVLALRAAAPEERPSYNQHRHEVVDLLGEFGRRAEQAGLDPHGHAYFALVALADEMAMNTEWEGARQWESDPLQVKYFGGFTAGDVFFERLDGIQAEGDREVLEVYYNCLCVGFRGANRDDPGALSSLRSRLLQRLSVLDLREEAHLSPNAYGRHLERPLLKRRFPFMWALPFVLGALGLYFAYFIILDRQVDEIRESPAARAAADDDA